MRQTAYLSARAAGVCTPLDPSKRRAAARGERGAAQRETLDENAMVHPRSPAKGGKGKSRGRTAGDAGTRWDAREERTRRRQMTREEERRRRRGWGGGGGRGRERGTTADPSGDGKVLGSTFPKRRWRLNLTVPRVTAAHDPASLVQGRENRRRIGLRSDTATNCSAGRMNVRSPSDDSIDVALSCTARCHQFRARRRIVLPPRRIFTFR